MIGASPVPGSQGAAILGVGSYRPTRVVTNAEICDAMGTTDEWIRRRTGIESRRFAGPDETIATMAARAAEKALVAAGAAPRDVDMVLVASMSNLRQSPGVAPEIARQVGTKAAAVDIGAACAGFCHALTLANSLACTGSARCLLVVGVERMTDIIDPTDRSTAALFADGAGAVVVGPGRAIGIGPVVWGSDGARGDLIAHSSSWLDYRDRPGQRWPTMWMAGQSVFRWIIDEMPAIALAAVEAAGVGVDDLGAFIPHQGNLRIIDELAKSLRLPHHVRVARDIVTAGNTSAASIPLAMERLLELGETNSGDLALLLGFGAGLSYAAQVVVLP